jgi:hypothetical protein
MHKSINRYYWYCHRGGRGLVSLLILLASYLTGLKITSFRLERELIDINPMRIRMAINEGNRFLRSIRFFPQGIQHNCLLYIY